MDWLRRLSVTLGLILARWGGWQEPQAPPPVVEYVRVKILEPCSRRHDPVCTEPHDCLYPHETYDGPIQVLTRARELCAEQDGLYAPLSEAKRAASGEARRHAVYARLIKEFPGVSRRMISRAIEAGLA